MKYQPFFLQETEGEIFYSDCTKRTIFRNFVLSIIHLSTLK